MTTGTYSRNTSTTDAKHLFCTYIQRYIGVTIRTIYKNLTEIFTSLFGE